MRFFLLEFGSVTVQLACSFRVNSSSKSNKNNPNTNNSNNSNNPNNDTNSDDSDILSRLVLLVTFDLKAEIQMHGCGASLHLGLVYAVLCFA